MQNKCKTALVKITNDLLLASDKGCISLLVLLYLSAAFDSIDHDILIDRLQNYTGIQGHVLRWFRVSTCPIATTLFIKMGRHLNYH